MTIKTIINNIRLRINDDDKYRFSDDDVLIIVNEAVRFIRNVFVEETPTLVAENPVAGKVEVGENVINVPFEVVKYLDVRIDKKPIHAESIHHIQDYEDSGTPRVFVPIGKQAIAIFPMPDKEVKYRIIAVGVANELALEDEVPFTSDYQDSIIEYVAMRLSMIDEFDQSLETQLLAEIREHIKSKLNDYAPQKHVVRSYY